jgi:hypothetical protein
MRRLETLHLDAIRFHGAELAGLAELPSFHTLKLERVKATSLSLGHLDVLTRCPQLTRADLIQVSTLQLIQRDWMQQMHAELDSLFDEGDVNQSSVAVDAHAAMDAADGTTPMERREAAAVVPVLPVVPSAYPDLLSLISACRHLSRLTWEPASRVLRDSVSRVRSMTHATHGMRDRRERARERLALRGFVQQRKVEIGTAKRIAATSAASAASQATGFSSVDTAPSVAASPPPPRFVYTRSRPRSQTGRDSIDLARSDSADSATEGPSVGGRTTIRTPRTSRPRRPMRRSWSRSARRRSKRRS